MDVYECIECMYDDRNLILTDGRDSSNGNRANRSTRVIRLSDAELVKILNSSVNNNVL